MRIHPLHKIAGTLMMGLLACASMESPGGDARAWRDPSIAAGHVAAGEPGQLTPATLFAEATAAYDSNEMERACEALERLSAALEDVELASQLEYYPKTLYYLGHAYQRRGLHREACKTFREGCTTWRGDEEFDGSNAQGFYKSARELLRISPDDPHLEALLEEAERIATEIHRSQHGPPPLTREERILEYRAVPSSSSEYEMAMVQIGALTYRQGRKEEGLALLDEYLDDYVTDERNSIQGDPLHRAERVKAMAVATFYRTLGDYGMERYRAVIGRASDYHLEYPDSKSMGAWTMQMVGSSLARTGRGEEANEYLELARRAYPERKFTLRLATELEAPREERK